MTSSSCGNEIERQRQVVWGVESRTGAVAWAMRQHPVSRPRSSNRTCGFPASGAFRLASPQGTRRSVTTKLAQFKQGLHVLRIEAELLVADRRLEPAPRP